VVTFTVLRLATTAVSLLLPALLAAEAQPARKVPRIGGLLGGSPEPGHSIEAFPQGLRELGYVEGQKITIEYRWAEGRLDRFPELASELVRLRVDLIFAPGTAAAQAAKKSTPTIPIVFATASNPVGDGLIASLARPGESATGLTLLAGRRPAASIWSCSKRPFPVSLVWQSSGTL
jgi:putative ABC transport system substrate-binding protein